MSLNVMTDWHRYHLIRPWPSTVKPRLLRPLWSWCRRRSCRPLQLSSACWPMKKMSLPSSRLGTDSYRLRRSWSCLSYLRPLDVCESSRRLVRRPACRLWPSRWRGWCARCMFRRHHPWHRRRSYLGPQYQNSCSRRGPKSTCLWMAGHSQSLPPTCQAQLSSRTQYLECACSERIPWAWSWSRSYSLWVLRLCLRKIAPDYNLPKSWYIQPWKPSPCMLSFPPRASWKRRCCPSSTGKGFRPRS